IISSPQVITVTATSVADITRFASSTVNLTPSGFTPIRVNAGGPAYTDMQSQVWSADTGYLGGQTYLTGAAVGNTTTPILYQTERYIAGNILEYRFTVPNGTYSVKLKF